MDRHERVAVCFAGLSVIVALCMILPNWLERLNPMTGDAPFYVMTAISIINDGDIEESNNYITDPDNPGMVRFADQLYPDREPGDEWRGWPSYPDLVQPHQAHTERAGLYSKHGVGLPLLIALPYAIGERLAVELLLIGIAALLTGQMVLLVIRSGSPAWTAVAIAIGLALSMPIGPYSLLIFPEVPAALLLVYAVRRLSADENELWQWVLAGLAIGYLPWLHQRFIPSAVFLALYALARTVSLRRAKPAIACLGPIAIGGFGLLGYNFWLYGGPIQNTADHAGFSDLGGTVNGAFGLLLDAQWGLLIVAPLMLLAIAALPTWLARDRRTALVALGACIPYLAVVAAYRVWWGEWGPPARYLAPVVPFAAASLGAWIASKPARRLTIAGLFWLPGMVLTIIGYVNPQRFFHQPDGFNKLVGRVDEALSTGISDLLVSFQPYAKESFTERATISLALVLSLVALTIVLNISILQHALNRITQSNRSETIEQADS